MASFDVVTFGSAVVDTFVDTEFSSRKGEISYEVGTKILVDDMRTDIGGGATNTGVAFARFGFKTGCICRIGKDNSGSDILRMFHKEKIKFLGSVDVKSATGHSIILDSKDRSRTILTYKGPGNSIKFGDLPKFKTRWLYYSSMLGESLKTQIRLAQNEFARGTRIAFNPSSYLVTNKEILPLLKLTHVLILNKEEAVALCRANKKYLKGIPLNGRKGDELYRCLRNLGPRVVVVTDKDNPAVAYDGEKVYSIKPHKIKVVERTGAGDAFAAGFVSGMIRNWPINKCLELALAEGESVLEHFGAKNNLIRRNLKK